MNYVYILTNKYNTTMYVGVTNNLERRISEHRQELIEGFTKKYHIHKLVYYEYYNNIKDAIIREKQIKGWRRDKKNSLVETINPDWNDLYDEINNDGDVSTTTSSPLNMTIKNFSSHPECSDSETEGSL